MQLKDTLNQLSNNTKLNKKYYLLILSSITFLILLVYFEYFSAQEVNINDISLTKVKYGEIEPIKNVIGEVMSRDTTALISQVSGIIKSNNLYNGKNIAKSELLVELENPEIQYAYVDINSQLLQLKNESKLQIAKKELEIFNKKNQLSKVELQLEFEKLKYQGKLKLAKKGVISALDIKSIELEIKIIEKGIKDSLYEIKLNEDIFELEKINYQSQIETLTNKLALEKSKVNKLSVTSPINGQVLRISDKVAVGASIQKGELLASIFDEKNLKIRLRVPPSIVKNLSVGLKSQIEIRNKLIPAEVSFIENKVNNGSVYVWLKAQINLSEISSEGENVNAKLLLPVKSNTRLLAKPLWYNGPGLYKSYCFKDEVLEPCEVEFGAADKNHVNLISTNAGFDAFELSNNSHWLGDTALRVRL